jgi:hypothetical protein
MDKRKLFKWRELLYMPRSASVHVTRRKRPCHVRMGGAMGICAAGVTAERKRANERE